MKRHWLRGMLLGVSLALLLAGGVALAQGLTLTVDQDCVECWPGPYDGLPTDEYLVEITFNGWDPEEVLCFGYYLNGEPAFENPPNCTPWPGSGPRSVTVAYPCESDRALSGVSGLDLRLSADGIEEFYGEWKLRAWQPGTDNADSVTWLLSEDCEAMEFVPEPGTIALLGSGLAGLAGYAALRWRSRS